MISYGCNIRIFAACVFTVAGVLTAGTASAQNVTYKYDDFGRVIEAVYPNGTKTTYSYDAANNRTAVTTAPQSTNQPPSCSNWSVSVNAPPYAGPVSGSLPASAFTSKCSDPDGGTLQVTSPSMPLNFTIYASQTQTYTYTVSDGQGGSASATLTISRP